MNVANLIAVLGWCMVVNFSVLLIWVIAFKTAPDLAYRSQRAFFAISREDFEVTMYRLMGYFKFTIIVFNLAPYIALRIVF